MNYIVDYPVQADPDDAKLFQTDPDNGMREHLEMTNLERMIAQEAAVPAANGIARKGLNTERTPEWRSPEKLAIELNTDIQTAVKLIDAWEIIDPKHRLISTFTEWTLAKSVPAAFDYFVGLAGMLLEAEDIPDTDAMAHRASLAPWESEAAMSDSEYINSAVHSDPEEDRPEPPAKEFAYQTMRQSRPWQSARFEATLKIVTDGKRNIFKRLLAAKLRGTCMKASVQEHDFDYMNARALSYKRIEIRKDKAKFMGQFAWMSWDQFRVFQDTISYRETYEKNVLAEQLKAKLSPRGRQLMTKLRNCKSSKQAGFFWHMLAGAKSEQAKLVTDLVYKPIVREFYDEQKFRLIVKQMMALSVIQGW